MVRAAVPEAHAQPSHAPSRAQAGSSAPRRVLLIANPISGGGRGRELALLFAMGIATQVAQLRVGWIDEEYFWVTVAVAVPLTLLLLSRIVDTLRSERSRALESNPKAS